MYKYILIICMFLFNNIYAQNINNIVVLGEHNNAETSGKIVVIGSIDGSPPTNIIISKKDGSEESFFHHGVMDFKGITSGDFNNDGLYEIAVFKPRLDDNEIVDRIIVFNKDGSIYSDFNAGDKLARIGDINGITSADLDNDGNDEIIISCSEKNGHLFNNLVAFNGTGDTVKYSNFDYPGGYNFEGIAGGDFNLYRTGDEIAVYESYNNDYDRITIFSNNLNYAYLYCYTSKNSSGSNVNYKLTSLAAGDIDNDNLDEIVTTSSNNVVIYKNQKYLKHFSFGGYNLLGVTCSDFNNDGKENIAVYRCKSNSPNLIDMVVIFNSAADGTVLSAFNYSNLGYGTFNITGITSNYYPPAISIVISDEDGKEENSFHGIGDWDYKDLATGDYDGDGISEIAVFRNRSNKAMDWIIVYDQNGNIVSNFYACDKVRSIDGINCLTSGDVNGDGIDEIIVSASDTSDNKFREIIAFDKNGNVIGSNFTYPGYYGFKDIVGADLDGNGIDEIACVTYYDQNYDRVVIFKEKVQDTILTALGSSEYFKGNNHINYKTNVVTSGDPDADGKDELIFSLSNSSEILIYDYGDPSSASSDYIFDTNISTYLEGITSTDIDHDGRDDIITYTSHNALNKYLKDNILIYRSNNGLDYYGGFNYLNKKYNSPMVVKIASGCFSQKHPFLYLDSLKITSLKSHTSHDFYDNIENAKNYDFFSSINDAKAWYNCSSSNEEFLNHRKHENIAKNLKYIGIDYQINGSTNTSIIDDFTNYASKYNSSYNLIKNNNTTINGNQIHRYNGVFFRDLLHEAYWISDICWAYDLLYTQMTKSQRITIRNKLLLPAAKRLIGYYPNRNNHSDGHNLAIASIGFLLNNKRLLGLAFKGTDISDDGGGKWRGFFEQLANADNNDPIIFDYPPGEQIENVGIYLPDYTHYEGTISYAYHDLETLVYLAEMASHNNYFKIEDLYPKVNSLAKYFVSTIFPFDPNNKSYELKFPAINDDFLSGLKTVSYLEILNSKFYSGSSSPYSLLLKKNTDNFDSFIYNPDSKYGSDDLSLINSSINYQDGGIAILRPNSGSVSPDNLMVIMDYGPYGGSNHGHSDRFNIILYKNKTELIRDIGRLSDINSNRIGYNTKFHNQYVRSTISHNTIIINGNRQADPNTEYDTKAQKNLSIYGGKDSEASYANKKCDSIFFDKNNNDSLQFISAKAEYGSCYGNDFSVKRTLSLIADKYIVDVVKINKQSGTTFNFSDWIIHGPNINIGTSLSFSNANSWDWELMGPDTSKYEGYQYFYSTDTTSIINSDWKIFWKDSTNDTLLKIWGINTTSQRLITAISPKNSSSITINDKDKRACIIVRKYNISNDWHPEYLSVIEPLGVIPITNVSVENDSILVIENKSGKKYYYNFKSFKLNTSSSPKMDYNILTKRKLLPKKFELLTNYPNPFNSSTVIPFTTPKKALVRIEVINILGQKLSVLTNSYYNAGYHKIILKNTYKFPSGIYIIHAIMREKSGGNKVYEFSKKILFIK